MSVSLFAMIVGLPPRLFAMIVSPPQPVFASPRHPVCKPLQITVAVELLDLCLRELHRVSSCDAGRAGRVQRQRTSEGRSGCGFDVLQVSWGKDPGRFVV